MKTLPFLLTWVAGAILSGRLGAADFPGNAASGFGGAVGQGSLEISDDGTTVTCSITKGAGDFNDNLVLYIDSQPGGFEDTSGFADDADPLRRAISGIDVAAANRSTLDFPENFTADFAIAIGPASAGSGGLWSLANGGANSLGFIASVNLAPTGSATSATYSFSFPVTHLGLTAHSGATFQILGTYLRNTGFRSDEALPGDVSGTQGWTAFTSSGEVAYTIGPVVTNTNDSGSGSLRQRIIDTPSGGTINFDFALSGQTILLGSEIVIGGNVVIDANFLSQGLVIDGGAGANRIFTVGSGQSLALKNLTLTGGHGGGAAGSGHGGAIYNTGALYLENCTFSGNVAPVSRVGGAICSVGADSSTTALRCIFTGNSTSGSSSGGGAIFADTSSVLNCTDCTFTANTSPNTGGAIHLTSDATATLSRCTFSGNGGAACVDAGAILASNSTLTVLNSTLTGNTATGNGGGLMVSGTATAEVRHCTVTGNIAPNGGGIQLNGGTLTLENSIIAGNTASANGPDIHRVTGDLIRAGACIVGDNTSVGTTYPAGSPNANADYAGTTGTPVKPLLAPLDDYGGPTRTMPPLPGSPAIDAAVSSDISSDQRVQPRVSGPFPDIGAVEAFAFSLQPLVDTDGDGIDDRLEPAYPQLAVGVNDSALDTDGDGSSDADELRNMTSPVDGNDYFRILSFAPAAGFDSESNPLFDVTFKTFPGLYYALEESPVLEGFDFIPGSGVIASSVSHATQVLLDSGRSFVRARRGPPSVRWATRVIRFSSQFDTDAWSAAQALGIPDIYPTYGDISSAWSSLGPDDEGEFIELGFDAPAPIIAVSIYETFGPGAVSKVSVRNSGTGVWTEVWTGTAAPAPEVARIFTVTFAETSFPVDAVRIDLDSPAVSSWNEIDAVSISR